jgi:DNA-binding transcriptional ArsR family regulator
VYDSDWDGTLGLALAPPTPPASGKAAALPAPGFTLTPLQAAGAGLLGIVAGALYLLWPALKAGPTALFSRIQGPQTLEHPARSNLVAFVAGQPGIHFKELRRQSGLANGALVHHLGKLEQSGAVVVRPAGRYRCYFPAGARQQDPALFATTKAAGARQLLAELREHPGQSTGELAQHTGLGRSTIQYHLGRLEEAGLVTALRDGSAHKYQLRADVAAS